MTYSDVFSLISYQFSVVQWNKMMEVANRIMLTTRLFNVWSFIFFYHLFTFF